MGWTNPFFNEIDGRAKAYSPRFLLETVTPPTEIGHGNWRITSHEALEGSPIIGMGGGPIIGSEVQARSWTSFAGAWSVPIVDKRPLMGKVWRGQLVRLRVGFAGWGVDEFEPVALGRVAGISGKPGSWRLNMWAIDTALRSRITATAGEYALFNSIGTETTLSANYTAGDGTVSVTSSAGFERQDDGTGTLKGAFLITPGSGDPFYLTWTAVAANVFTVSGTGQFDTTAANASSGSTVTEVAYIDDHPIDAVRKILASTGTANANGSYDTLPEQWGFGLADYLLDHDDMSRQKLYTSPSSGSDEWDILALEEQDNALGWMQGWLSLGGLFMATRQGRITVRGCLNPSGNTQALQTGVPYSTPLNDEEIIAESVSVDHWEQSYPIEYRTHRVRTSPGGSGATDTSEGVTSLPAFDRYVTDLQSYIYSNEIAQRNHLKQRIGPWVLRIPERVTLKCGGLRRAGLAPGDIVPLTTNVVGGRMPDHRDGYREARAMVARVAPDWWQGTCSLSLLVLPDRADEFA